MSNKREEQPKRALMTLTRTESQYEGHHTWFKMKMAGFEYQAPKTRMKGSQWRVFGKSACTLCLALFVFFFASAQYFFSVNTLSLVDHKIECLGGHQRVLAPHGCV